LIPRSPHWGAAPRREVQRESNCALSACALRA